jgi:hypothetical protein
MQPYPTPVEQFADSDFMYVGARARAWIRFAPDLAGTFEIAHATGITTPSSCTCGEIWLGDTSVATLQQNLLRGVLAAAGGV